ncbi:MAG: NAD(+) synthase [Ruminococcaceae bacterium]|nr:NAD(+) synthase [Oscillospiraceae bacterium]
MYKFDVKKATDGCIAWIQDWFEKNGKGCNAIIGISGGKDSSVVAALCCRALGKERVFGVLMPDGEQCDIDYSHDLCEFLEIENIVVDIHPAVAGVYEALGGRIEISEQSRINLPPRIRMTTLYAISQSKNGRVANTCNLSEDWVGYSTRYGDSAGDFGPISRLTVAEVKEMGRYLGLPEKFIEKAPSDGLSGKTDEDKLGFTYAMLDKYIREGVIDDEEKKAKIDRLHVINKFKLETLPVYEFDPAE